MSTGIVDEGGGHPGRFFRAGMWLGHYYIRIMVTAVIAYVASVATTHLTRHIPGGDAAQKWPVRLLGIIMLSALLGMLSALLGRIRYHDRALCLRCLTAVPLSDPDGAVRRHRRELRFVHAITRRRLAAAVSLLAFGAVLPAVWIIWSRVPSMLGGAVDGFLIALAVFFAYALRALRWHVRLQPWCPWCRHGDGGDGPQDEVPDPIPPAVRPRVPIDV